MPSRLFLIDTFGLIFRAFYGRARAAVPSMRTSGGLPTEAVYVFATMLRKLISDQAPDAIAAVWEGEGPTFRDEQFADYKANREAMPEDLAQQLPYIRRLIEAQNIPIVAADGFEADDAIGSLARQAAEHDVDVYIVSSDKDLMQLVGDRVYFLNPMKGDEVFDSEGVQELMGVTPKQIIDLLALKGDSVDNIPGAPGIGDKGAKQLIADYGSVEGAIEHAAEVKRKTYRESLQNHVEQILLSKRLATIAVDAPVELDMEALALSEPDVKALAELYGELEFRSLLSQLDTPAERRKETESVAVESREQLEKWLEDQGEGLLTAAIDLAPKEELVEGGVAFCVKAGKTAIVSAEQLQWAKAALEDAERAKRVHDGKAALKALRRAGVELKGVRDDTMLAGFLVDSSRTDYSFDKAVARKLGREPAGGLGHAADEIRELGEALGRDLDGMELRHVYEQIELPLTPILAGMEETGVLLDGEQLKSLSIELGLQMAELEQEIHRLGGRVFNVNSPKQLAEVLYEEMQLPAPARRGKTKARSTAADVLEHLAAEHPIAGKILEFREYSKLKSTYVDALPALIDRETGRLHTTFNPTGSATGRLSSSNPNLQNIPVRTELGRRIRAAFVAPKGKTLLAADYSQIELRVLAHMSGDKRLLDAFRKGEDIHTRTAAEVFGVPPMMVGPDERRKAKAVNFGIVYGLSAFGLSNQLGIPQKEAREYINAYLELYSGVKTYMENTVAQARTKGYAATLFGRRRPITDLDSRNPAARGFAERTAINSPIQGTAADLIKLAMIRVDERLKKDRSRAVMLLQVHDELLFEVAEGEAKAVGEAVREEMEQAHELDAPLVTDVKVGGNWRDMWTEPLA